METSPPRSLPINTFIVISVSLVEEPSGPSECNRTWSRELGVCPEVGGAINNHKTGINKRRAFNDDCYTGHHIIAIATYPNTAVLSELSTTCNMRKLKDLLSWATSSKTSSLSSTRYPIMSVSTWTSVSWLTEHASDG